ncbi:MAG: sugar phosphorylase [Bacteroidota bacterium]
MDSLSPEFKDKIVSRLKLIYRNNLPDDYCERLFELIFINHRTDTSREHKWSEKDAVLITYGDSIINEKQKPLSVLNKFLKRNLSGFINNIHILPFFPYTSDDGFSITDFKKVNPELGKWKHIRSINNKFDLMVDLVINHVSTKHIWFQNFIEGKSPGRNYFIEVDPHIDLSSVVRPRSTPVLTPFETSRGVKYVWTTFSADQVDLNFGNPEVLLEILKVLFLYIQNGARIIRLDAIAYIYKKIGTTCIHLPEVHNIVKLFREIVDYACPYVILLTETNVPHKENLSYFGDYDEADMIYQFSLPPLLLHALHTGDGEYLRRWASSVPNISKKATYFNFTASHDGIGVRPLEGLLPEEEFNQLLTNIKNFGGMIGTKTDADGNESPYEINISYFDALKGTKEGIDRFQIERFICSQTIMMAFKGIPAFYIHSLLATSNDYEGYQKTGIKRSINRKKWDYKELKKLLANPETSTSEVFNELLRRISIRTNHPVFHPDSSQEIIDVGDDFFVIHRVHEDAGEIFALSNLTGEKKEYKLNFIDYKLVHELISDREINTLYKMIIEPYASYWFVIPPEP